MDGDICFESNLTMLNKSQLYAISNRYFKHITELLEDVKLGGVSVHCSQTAIYPGHADRPTVRTHQHSVTEVLVIVSGVGCLVVDGEQKSFSPGQMVVAPPEKIHDWYCTEDIPVHQRWMLSFKCENPGSEKLIAPFNIYNPDVYDLDESYFQNADIMIREMKNNYIARDFIVNNCFKNIILSFIRAVNTPDNIVSHLDYGGNEIVEKVDGFLVQNVRKRLSMNELANYCNMSCSNLEHLYRNATGMSISKSFQKIKIYKVEEALRNDLDAQIKSVALAFGFRSFSYFSRLFRQRFGMSPSQYTEEIKRLYSNLLEKKDEKDNAS
jgi:AraC-like DNA-binding protein/mannose-6-phosphate isomerase-like protein (cupin superfamily)